MKTGFYPKLAFDGIRKNRRMYFPFILTSIGMVMMFYIISYLQFSTSVEAMYGGKTMQSMLNFGSIVVGFFACIFLFYTNSFLIRRRKKEFGLYHILGMGKRNIARILFWETLLTVVISLVAGIGLGFLFSKLAELALARLMHSQTAYTLQISPDSIFFTIATFGFIFILLFFNAFRQIHFANAISLVRSENVGEKPPKGNIFLGLLGLVSLVVAYYLAITIEDPVSALGMFFVAVLLVILGTYLLMIAGSVLFCRLLQKNKRYYYKANHFVSVSSMAYRMKRNGAGLASICVLATMVLVMLSTTFSLYFGVDDVVSTRCPRQFNLSFGYNSFDELSVDNTAIIRESLASATDQYGCTLSNVTDYRRASFYGYLLDDDFVCDTPLDNDYESAGSFAGRMFYFVPLEDYNKMMGTDETLNDDEALLFVTRDCSYNQSTISFEHGKTYSIKKQLKEFVPDSNAMANISTTFVLIVPDVHAAIDTRASLEDGSHVFFYWLYDFDTDLSQEKQISLTNDLYAALSDTYEKNEAVYTSLRSYSIVSRADDYEDFFTTFGGLFYLAIILSIVFLLAAVLIIYYKQISEGYEDQSRFEIMQKVGMTKREIRKSINSQLLTVFFLPLAGAGLHLIFAFPMIRQILSLFKLTNLELFTVVTLICFALFALFYTIVYRITSNAYYHIVSGTREEA
jgi:putative ABC transport system permease protein